MGGYVPLGYRVVERRLVIHEREAALVRKIFDLYLEHRNVRRVAAELQRRKMLRPAATARTGRAYGGKPFSRGHLYKILSNPIYVGEIHHRGQRYQGQHQGIVERKVWNAVQARLATNWGERCAQKNAKEPSLLAGLLYGDCGRAFETSHTSKGARRYRYYVSPPSGDAQSPRLRIAAHELERPLVDKLKLLLSDHAKLIGLLRPKGRGPASLRALTKSARKAVELLDTDAKHDKRALLLALVHRIVVSETEVRIEIEREGPRSSLANVGISERVASATQAQESARPAPAIAYKPSENSKHRGKPLTIHLPIQLKRRGVETRLIIEGSGASPPSSPDPALLKAVSRASAWFEHLTSGGIVSLGDLATQEKLTVSTIARILRLAFIAPHIVEEISAGSQPAGLTAYRLMRGDDLPPIWSKQRETLGN